MKILKFHIVLFLFIISGNLFCQPEIKREYYSTENGLPHNAVSDMLQDSRGYMWFATWDGLSRFDGFEFVNYKTGVDSNIPFFHNRIRNLYEDKFGNIWILMYDEKLFRLNRKTDKFESLINLFPNSTNARLAAPLFSKNGDIWVSLRNEGILQIKTDSVSNHFTVEFYPLKGITVNQLFEDSYSTIWLATSNGIRKLNSKDIFFEKQNILVSAQLGQYVYWGTDKGDILTAPLNLSKEGKPERLNLSVNSEILYLANSPLEGALYIGTRQQGLFRYDTKRGVIKQVIPRTWTITHLYTDSKGLIWALTDQPGVVMYDPLQDKYTSFTQKVVVPEYYSPGGSIFEHDGIVWVVMNKGGFGYYDRTTKKFEYFHNNPYDPNAMSNVVASAKIDSSNVLWLSTHKRGIEKLTVIDRKVDRVLLEKNSPSLAANELRAFGFDKDSLLWVAAKSGVLYRLDKDMKVINRISNDNNGNPIGLIYTITQDPSGDLWLGTKGNGLFRMHKEPNGKYIFTHYKHNPADPFSLSSDNVYCVLIDSKKQIWVATYGGGVNLMQNNNGQITFLSSRNTFKGYPINSCNKVRALAEGDNGEIWAGSTEGVVAMKYNPKKKDVQAVVYKKEVDNPSSLSNNDIIQIFKDSNGYLWFATIGGGLSKRTGTSKEGKAEFISYTVHDGLPSNEIKSITEDKDGNLWFATEHTICFFNFSTRIFSTLSILEGVDGTMFSEATATVIPTGEILIGTLNGYYLIDKKKLSNAVVGGGFKLQITDFQVNEKATSPRLNAGFENYIPESSLVTLPDRHSVFSIKFASLNYSLQHRIHYQYILVGYDKEWRNGDVTRKATYSNIPAGDYTFKVKAFTADNPDVYEVKELQIHIPPDFWARKEAFVLYGFIFISLVVGVWFVLYRRKMILKKFKVLKIGPSEIVFHDNKDYKFISGLLDWLEENYTNPELEIKDMAAFSGLSRTSFYNRLKALVQMSPVEFVSDFRMKKAKMYIEKSNMTIAEIAYRTGFNDPVYFTRLFKSKYKITPSECRKNASTSQLIDEKAVQEN